MHYSRQRRGVPLEDAHPEVGSPSGLGSYGLLDDDGQTVACHECGHRARSLGNHIRVAHGMSAREYKLRHGLPLTRGLVSTTFHEESSAA